MNSLAKTLCLIAVFVGTAAVLSTSAQAGNVDLSTVPKRDSVQLTIYNSEDLTLVRETRTVTFKKGNNPLEFSWANTLIDPSSVELKFLTHADKLDVADTTFPHDKPQKLYWNVNSEFDGEAAIQITYFTSGISWSADYICVADKDESEMSFEGFVRINNNSGEEYEDAQVRLVVGNINLVEKIAQLAQIPLGAVHDLRTEDFSRMKLDAAKAVFDAPVASAAPAPANKPAEKQIVKEGLSEYFIYTVEGTETIPNGWAKRMRSFEGQKVPFKIQYRYRPQEYGDQLVRMYLLTNNTESKLGTTPLPDGMVRLFKDNGRDGLSYLTQQQTKYVPIGDKIELNLGADPEVIFELIKLKSTRDNLLMQLGADQRFQKVGENTVATEANSSVVGWDDHSIYTQRIRNYSGKPIDVQIRRPYGGHVVFRSALEPTLFDYRTVEFQKRVPAGQKVDLMFEVLQHQGHNATQGNVTLEQATIQP